MDNEKKRRNTKQKNLILDFIKKNKDIHLIPEQILFEINNNGENVSQATIYRILNSLTKDGIIRKYISSKEKSSCYQYIDNEKCKNHYHLICNECGKIIHFDSELIFKIKDEIKENEKFEIDPKMVTFYGKCKSCI